MIEAILQKLSSDGFWSISGALIGAFVGALCGIFGSLYLDGRREDKVKYAFYKEAEFLSDLIGAYFKAVVLENEKSKIFLAKNESFNRPLDLDFSVLNTLFLELYKTKNILSSDHRQFVMRVRPQWERIRKLDIERIEKTQNTRTYNVSRSKSKDIIFLVVDLLYYFDQLAVQRQNFSFGDISDEAKRLSVFTKYKIDNVDLIENNELMLRPPLKSPKGLTQN